MLKSRPAISLGLAKVNLEQGLKYALGRGARLTVEQARTIAEQATGLSDGGDDTFYMEGLTTLLDATKREHVSFAGRNEINGLAWSSLARRYRYIDAKKRSPERFDTPLRRPFLVMGAARTGTTLLHRLLALDPAFYGIPKWELYEPFPPADGPDTRRAEAWERHEQRSKGLDHIHFNTPDTPEECVVLELKSFVTGQFWVAAPIYDYLDWTLQRVDDLQDQVYADYIQVLRHLQAEHPDRAFALKSPSHVAAVGVIQRRFPEAMIVNTVRDPISWSNSTQSLIYQHHRNTSTRLDLAKLVAANTRMMQHGNRRHIEQRTATNGNIIDVYYDDLMKRPIDVVRAIYDHHGVDWPGGHEQALQKYLDEQPKAKHGEHRYSSADFGLTDQKVLELYGEYVDFFGLHGATRDASITAA